MMCRACGWCQPCLLRTLIPHETGRCTTWTLYQKLASTLSVVNPCICSIRFISVGRYLRKCWGRYVAVTKVRESKRYWDTPPGMGVSLPCMEHAIADMSVVGRQRGGCSVDEVVITVKNWYGFMNLGLDGLFGTISVVVKGVKCGFRNIGNLRMSETLQWGRQQEHFLIFLCANW